MLHVSTLAYKYSGKLLTPVVSQEVDWVVFGFILKNSMSKLAIFAVSIGWVVKLVLKLEPKTCWKLNIGSYRAKTDIRKFIMQK